MTVTQQKKNSNLHVIKQLADDKDKQSSKPKQLQHISNNNTEEDDCDDNYPGTCPGERPLRWSKPMAWTKMEVKLLKHDEYFKSPESGLRAASAATGRVKSKIRSDDIYDNGKMNKSLEFERPPVRNDNPSVATSKYASLQKFSSNYPGQISHNGSFQTDDDISSEISEAETYTICTADQDRAVIAAREKISEVFRVGIKDDMPETEVQNSNNELQRNLFDIQFIDDENNLTEEEEDTSENDNSLQSCKSEGSAELENFTELTTAAVEACKRKPEDVFQPSQEDSSLNMQDSDDVICLTFDSNKDSLGDRKSTNYTDITLTSSFPMPPIKGTSINKRLLPRIPGKDDLADHKSDTGDSDTGFFEVLSADAPPIRPIENKKASRLELNCYVSEPYQKRHPEGEFEVIADVPRMVGDAHLSKDKSSNDNTLNFIQKNKLLTNSSNTRGPSSLSQSEDDELKEIFYDAPRSGRVTEMTATEKPEYVSDRKPTLHSLTGNLNSTTRFYDTALPNETSRNQVQKPIACNSITTSKGQAIFSRANNQDRLMSANEGFVPITFGRSSVRSEGRKLPGSPTKPMNNTKSEFISRGRGGLGPGGKGSLRETHREGFDSSCTSSVSQPSTPRLAQRVSLIQNQRNSENTVESRPPLSGSRQKTVVSKTVSQGSAIVSEPGTPSRTPNVRQRSLSRPTYSRGDPQISLSRPLPPSDDSQRSQPRPPLSREDPSRQQLQLLKHSSFDRSHLTESMPPSRSKQHQAYKGQRQGETHMPEKVTSFDNEARMKRSKSVTTVLRSRTSDVENPKLQAYHERMKYDPKKAIQDSKKHRLSASSRSDDTDAGSYEEMQNHNFSRNRPGSMSQSDHNSRKTGDYQSSRSSFKQSGTRPRSARTRLPSDDGLNHSTSSDIDAANGIHSTTIPSIQNLSEDIHELLNKIKEEKIRTHTITQVTSPSANRATSSVDDPQLNELRKTLKKVKQVLQSKFHS